MANDRYILHKKIARGGMAEIYLGKQVGEDGFQRLCCIKRVLPQFAKETEFISMFRDEAHICKRLQHANIVRVEGFEEVHDSYAIVMEFVKGVDLRAVLSNCEKHGLRLSVPMAVYIASEAARGLHYAHTRTDELTGQALGIVHRDISPQNLLVSFEGEVKVTDFGIADSDAKDVETRPGVVKGKYSYMSPEQITAGQVDHRTDIFALGIVLWEMLAMQRLFQGGNEVETISLVRDCVITRNLRLMNPDVDQELYHILEGALKKDPNQRFPSAAAFERSLRVYLNKTYREFTSQDLSFFLKKILDHKRLEFDQDIRHLLSTSKGSEKNALGETPDPRSPKYSLTEEELSTSFKLKGVTTVSSVKPLESEDYSRRQGNNKYTYSQANAAASAPRIQAVTKSYRHYFVLVLIAMLSIFGLFYASKRQELPQNIELRTTPNTVKISVNGKRLRKGHYIKTPITIATKRLRRGQNTIKFSRPGFLDETFSFSLKDNKLQPVNEFVLEQIEKMAPLSITLGGQEEEGSKGKVVRVVINDGLYEGLLRDHDLNVKHIVFGRKHSIEVFPVLEQTLKSKKRKKSSDSFKCIFTPRSTKWIAPYVVEIFVNDKKCRYP